MTVSVLPHIPTLLLPYIDRWTVQEPSFLDLEIVQAMQAQIDAGVAWLLGHGFTYVFLRRVTPFVGGCHIFNAGTPWGLVRAVRAITETCLMQFQKLEARTRDQRIGSVIMRCGWQQEAIYRGSFAMPDGTFADEYGYGVTRWDQL